MSDDTSSESPDETAADETAADETAADEQAEELAARAAELRAQARSGEAIPIDDFRRKSRRSFLTGAAGIVGAGAFWNYVQTKSDPVDGIPGILRNTLEVNESIWSNLPQRSAREFDISEASPIQFNARIGIREEIDLAAWTVRVEGPDGETIDELDISTFEKLDQQEIAFEHKCIEGWSNITHWGGPRFRDFHELYTDQVGDVKYVGLETPDGEYYVGWDLEAILHPQTILAMREHGEPLEQRHGAPLRLATPNKYGIKTIKRIGVIRYTNERPADFWAERSYDWFAGL